MPEQTAIAYELANERLRDELENLEDQLTYEQRHGPVSGDPSVEAELVSTRQKRGKR